MDLLIDRIENPGHRKSAPLVPSGRGATGVPMRRMTSGDERRQQGQRVIVNLPTISVNDKPVAPGQDGQGRRSFSRKSSLKKNEERDQHHERAASSYHHGRHSVTGPDVMSASAGMFSDCMFKSESQRPVRHSPTSTTASSSSSSLYGGKNVYADSSIESKSSNHRHRHHSHYHHSSKSAQGRRCSFSNVGLNDNKRLVNQFLRSMGPTVSKIGSSSGQALSKGSASGASPEQDSAFAGYITGTHGSLQSLLYHDLGSAHLTRKHTQMIPPSASSSSESSPFSVVNNDTHSSSASSSPYDSEDSSSITNFDKWDVNGSGLTINSGISLNYNEVDFYRRHIGAELHKFEDTLKHNLKEIIMKNETDMQKNWKSFDLMIAQLDKLRNDAQVLHDSVQGNHLVTLRKDFDQNDEDSYISNLSASVKTNANQLKDLEARIDCCKKKLLQQRDTLRKLEGLLSLEDSLLNSQKTSKLAYKYRYMVFDVGAFIGVVFVVLSIKWFIWS